MLLICAALFMFTACTTTPSSKPAEADVKSTSTLPPAPEGGSAVVFEEGIPGGIIVNTVEVTARVIAIEYASRKATLEGPDGKTFDIKAGPEAVNFDQAQVGDLLKVTVTEELVAYLDKEGKSLPDGSAAMVGLAPKGAKPGGVIAETTQVTATIIAIDSGARTATLQFEDGSSKTFPVRDDIDLTQYKAGEKVVFLITEMIAISVEKQ
jgi:hypothetical protein